MSKSVKDLLKEKFGITRIIKEVRGNIYCSDNELTSLEGTPQKVNGNFSCSYNNLTSLERSPLEINGDFDCSYNQLTSLERAPEEVGGVFDCANNKTKFTRDEVKEVCIVRGQIYV